MTDIFYTIFENTVWKWKFYNFIEILLTFPKCPIDKRQGDGLVANGGEVIIWKKIIQFTDVFR